MAYNVAGNLRQVRPGAAYLEGQDRVFRNALAERDMAGAEQAQQFSQQNALMQRQRQAEQDAITAQDRAQTQEQNKAKQVYTYLSHLAKAPSPEHFNYLADRMAGSELFREMEITREDLTPEEVRQYLPMFAAEAGEAPVAEPVKWETISGPRGSRISRNPLTNEEKQIVGPDNTEGGGASAPSGYRWVNGRLEPIPGGPADPNGPASRKQVAPLRKEFRGLQSVKDYEAVLPLVKSAETAPDTGYGDLQLIYTVGKVLDPGSVVREGELALTIKAGTPMSRIIGAGRFNIGKGGRLGPEQREQIIGMLKERVSGYEQAYQQDYQTYTEYAQSLGLDPVEVVGKGAANAYGPAGGRELPPTNAQGWKLMTDASGNKAYVSPDGTQFEEVQ